MFILYSYNMEKHSEEADHIHKLTIAELLGVIDHKVRGIQQLIIALRDFSSNGSLISSLDQVMKGMKELQEIYQGFLNVRRVEEETLKIDEFLLDKFNLPSTCSDSIKVDRAKLEFICDAIREFGGDECKVTSESYENGCVIKFSSPVFSEISIDEFKYVPESLYLLSIFAVKKITEKMNGLLSVSNNEITIKFPYSTS